MVVPYLHLVPECLSSECLETEAEEDREEGALPAFPEGAGDGYPPEEWDPSLPGPEVP